MDNTEKTTIGLYKQLRNSELKFTLNMLINLLGNGGQEVDIDQLCLDMSKYVILQDEILRLNKKYSVNYKIFIVEYIDAYDKRYLLHICREDCLDIIQIFLEPIYKNYDPSTGKYLVEPVLITFSDKPWKFILCKMAKDGRMERASFETLEDAFMNLYGVI